MQQSTPTIKPFALESHSGVRLRRGLCARRVSPLSLPSRSPRPSPLPAAARQSFRSSRCVRGKGSAQTRVSRFDERVEDRCTEKKASERTICGASAAAAQRGRQCPAVPSSFSLQCAIEGFASPTLCALAAFACIKTACSLRRARVAAHASRDASRSAHRAALCAAVACVAAAARAMLATRPLAAVVAAAASAALWAAVGFVSIEVPCAGAGAPRALRLSRRAALLGAAALAAEAAAGAARGPDAAQFGSGYFMCLEAAGCFGIFVFLVRQDNGTAGALADQAGAAGDGLASPSGSSSGICPEWTASVVSRVTFSWLSPLIERGMDRALEQADLWALPPPDRVEALDARFGRFWNRELDAKLVQLQRDGVDPNGPAFDAVKGPRSSRVESERLPAASALSRRSRPPRLDTADVPRYPTTVSARALARACALFVAPLFSVALPCRLVVDVSQFAPPILISEMLAALGEAGKAAAPDGGVPLVGATTNGTAASGTDSTPLPSFSTTSPILRAYASALLLFFALCVGTIADNQHFQQVMRAGFRLRSVLTYRICDKVLRLTPDARARFFSGKLYSAVGTDVDQLEQLNQHILGLVSAPLRIVVAVALLWRCLGPASMGAVALVLLVLPVQSRLMALQRATLRGALARTDERAKLEGELVTGLEAVKCSGWEIPFLQRAARARYLELSALRTAAKLSSANVAIVLAVPVLSAVGLFGFYSLFTRSSPTAVQAFTALSLLAVMRSPMFQLPSLITAIIASSVALERLAALLSAPEAQPIPPLPPVHEAEEAQALGGCDREHPEGALDPRTTSLRLLSLTPGNLPAIPPPLRSYSVVLRGSFSWSLQDSPSISGLDLRVRPGELVAIVGPTGSGKTSLLAALLGLLEPLWKPECGEMEEGGGESVGGASGPEAAIAGASRAPFVAPLSIIRGRCAYVPQTAFIASATIRENVVFNSSRVDPSQRLGLERGGVRDVKKRIDELRAGGDEDAGVRDDSGAVLASQHAPDSMLSSPLPPFSPALYASALHASCLAPDLAAQPAGDLTELGERGVTISGGQKQRVALARAAYSRPDVALLDDPLSALDAKVGRRVFSRLIRGELRSCTRFLVTNQLQYVRDCDRVLYLEKGRVVEEGKYEDLLGDGGGFAQLMSRAVHEDDDGDAGERKSGEAEEDHVEELASERKAGEGEALAPEPQGAADAFAAATAAAEARAAIEGAIDGEKSVWIQRRAKKGATVVDDSEAALLDRAEVECPDSLGSPPRRLLRFAPAILDASPGPSSSSRPHAASPPPQCLELSTRSVAHRPGEPVSGRTSEPAPVPAAVSSAASSSSSSSSSAREAGTLYEEEERSRGRVQRAVIATYARALGGARVVALVASAFLFVEVFRVSGQLWLQHWTSDVQRSIGGAEGLGGNELEKAGGGAMSENGTVVDLGRRLRLGAASDVSPLPLPIRGRLVASLLGDASRLPPLSTLSPLPLAPRVLRRALLSTSSVDPTPYLIAYAIFSLLQVASTAAAQYGMRTRGLRAAGRLHGDMLARLVGAQMRFFHVTPSGRVVNRLTRDTADVDRSLPDFSSMMLTACLQLVSAVALVVALSPPVALLVAPSIYLFCATFRRYQTSVRELKRVDSLTRSPVYGTLGEAIVGIASLRAFRAEGAHSSKAALFLDDNVVVSLAMKSANRWFSMRMETLSAGLATAAAVCVVAAGAGPALAGNVLTTSLSFTAFVGITMRSVSTAETSFNSVERVLEYSAVPPLEDPTVWTALSRAADANAAAGERRGGASAQGGAGPNGAEETGGAGGEGAGAIGRSDDALLASPLLSPPGPFDASPSAQLPNRAPLMLAEWPLDGTISYANVEMRYRPGLPLVLRGLTFTIPGGSSCGVVGRTGAGKSSLVGSLFRLTPICGGTITIGGLDASKLPLHRLRRSMAVIPQFPVLFVGTVRFNLDPTGTRSDAELWTALRRAHLKEAIEADPRGLDLPVAEGGAPLSAGQRQLLALARALLVRAKILILDEATASVDVETDSKIQHTVRTEFADCTVLAVAHRLHTVADFDRILVMDAGRAVEFGSPDQLLENESGVFAGMVRETGKGGERALKHAASQAALQREEREGDEQGGA